MIKETDLRIGNWVMVKKTIYENSFSDMILKGDYSLGDGKEKHEIITIENISCDGINDEVQSSYYGDWTHNYQGHFLEWGYGQSGIYGIPLTKELLTEWCGFEADGNQVFYFSGYGISLSEFSLENIGIDTRKMPKDEEKKVGEWFRKYKLGRPHRQIKYLHELQNFYKENLGTELEIKIPT